MTKIIEIDPRAYKELRKFSDEVYAKFIAMFDILEENGKLIEPYGKKMSNSSLFEIRIKYKGQWRALYAYIQINKIIILSAFRKKTQKTPKKEMKKAQQRLKYYKKGN